MDLLNAIFGTLLTAVASIAVMFLLTKLTGNKQISQLNTFDYINGITIGSIAAEMALSDSLNDLLVTAMAMVIYGLTGFFISLATMHSMSARRFFSGEPLILVENGAIYQNNIKKAKLDLDDLLAAARCEGIFSAEDISLAVMETNGRISFRQTEGSRPVNLNDLGQSPSEKTAPVNLIMDGMLMEKNIEQAGLTVKQVSDELLKKGKSPDDIFLAVLDDSKLLFYPKDNSGGKLDNYT